MENWYRNMYSHRLHMYINNSDYYRTGKLLALTERICGVSVRDFMSERLNSPACIESLCALLGQNGIMLSEDFKTVSLSGDALRSSPEDLNVETWQLSAQALFESSEAERGTFAAALCNVLDGCGPDVFSSILDQT